MVWAVFICNPGTKELDANFTDQLVEKSMQKGVYSIRTGCGTIKFGPPLTIAEDNLSLVENNITWVSNESDNYALEEALLLKEAQGGEVVACTLGNESARQVLKDAMAKGADRSIFLSDSQFDGLDVLSIAKAFALILKDENFDLIMSGLQSDDQGNSQLGVLLAELMNMSHATLVMGTEVQDDNTIKVKRELESGWVQYHRPKTGVYRRAKLWPETVESLRNVEKLNRRAKLRKHHDLVFLTCHGAPWTNERTAVSALSKEFRRLANAAGVYRAGSTFYTLRRTFRTIADRSKDQACCDLVMGHETAGMAALYRQRIDDDRLEAVADIVHKWLFNN